MSTHSRDDHKHDGWHYRSRNCWLFRSTRVHPHIVRGSSSSIFICM